MSNPVTWPGANGVLGAPPGAENVSPLPVFRNGTCCVSAWQLSADELAEVARTGMVFISVFAGQSQPPVYVGSEASVRDVVADYGAWKK